jgi:hypothetical protein
MEQTVKCKYIFERNYNPKYVNGAYGGISSRGEIIVNFYLERTPLPHSQTFTITDGLVTSEVLEEAEPNDHAKSVVRVVESGVILDYANAKEIYRWLGEHLKNLEQLNKPE